MTNSNAKTKKTLIAITLAAITLAFSPNFSLGDQTAGEKATAESNTAGRKVKKGVNRAKEAVCTEGDIECAAKKAKHRGEEGARATGDKAKEGADAVDSNSKTNH